LFRCDLQGKTDCYSIIPPTEVGGYFKYSLFPPKKRLDLNNPPASAGGILQAETPCTRLGLNHPPISIGGIDESKTVVIDFFSSLLEKIVADLGRSQEQLVAGLAKLSEPELNARRCLASIGGIIRNRDNQAGGNSDGRQS
jgi:hypothetical protein